MIKQILIVAGLLLMGMATFAQSPVDKALSTINRSSAEECIGNDSW